MIVIDKVKLSQLKCMIWLESDSQILISLQLTAINQIQDENTGKNKTSSRRVLLDKKDQNCLKADAYLRRKVKCCDWSIKIAQA